MSPLSDRNLTTDRETARHSPKGSEPRVLPKWTYVDGRRWVLALYVLTEGPEGRSDVLASSTPEYFAWRAAISRCTNPKNRKWPLYGGRGIKVCDLWMGSFGAFLADLGLRPSAGHSLDRIDSNGNYEPGNCRWATIHEQNNNRSLNRRVVINGQSMTVAEASRLTGIPDPTIRRRLTAGMSDEAATTPGPLQLKRMSVIRNGSGYIETPVQQAIARSEK